METNPIILAILALLALPGVTSLVVSAIRKLSDATGVDPRVIVYGVSLVVTGVLVATGTVSIPAFNGDPASYILAWLTWATVNGELARRVYELLLKHVPVLAPPA